MADDGLMIPPQMLMDVSHEHVEGLRHMGRAAGVARPAALTGQGRRAAWAAALPIPGGAAGRWRAAVRHLLVRAGVMVPHGARPPVCAR